MARAMKIAKAPLSSIFMNLFMMYMVGNSLNIFVIFTVGYLVWGPLQAIMKVSQRKSSCAILVGCDLPLTRVAVYYSIPAAGVCWS